MALQHDDRSTLAEQANARTTAPGVLDQRDGPAHDHHGHDHDDDHEEGHDHSHGFDWAEAARIAFVALAAVAVWFKLWEPFSAVSVIGIAGLARRRLAHPQGSFREHPGAAHDDGTLHDDSHRRGCRNRPVLHGSDHHPVCARRRSA